MADSGSEDEESTKGDTNVDFYEHDSEGASNDAGSVGASDVEFEGDPSMDFDNGEASGNDDGSSGDEDDEPNITNIEYDEEGNKIEYASAEPSVDKAALRAERVKQLREARGNAEADKRRCLDLPTINGIRNKTLRRLEMQKYLRIKKKTRKLERKQRKKAGITTVVKTIENTREPDVTMIGDLANEDNEEIAKDIAADEFSDYFNTVYEPKVLVTFSDNPHNKTRAFGFELCRTIPNSTFRLRNRASIKKMVKGCETAGFTDIIVINEDHREPNGMLVIHLPTGPTAYFRLSNVQTTAKLKRNFQGINTHRPEVILNNFSTRLGNTIARMLASLFHYDPQFKGRRAVTFHNQRDYIFFRNHRYEFKSNKKVSLREVGPRFTLRLQSLQQGTFDSKTGEYEWLIRGKRHAMEKNRRTFFL